MDANRVGAWVLALGRSLLATSRGCCQEDLAAVVANGREGSQETWPGSYSGEAKARERV